MIQGATESKIWDVVVIGGGPAGMMAAGKAAEKGCTVLLLEKNPSLGKKLLITGGGRCNVTNAKPDVRTLLAKYKGSDQFLFSAFSQHAVTETLDFFHSRSMMTKEENEGRVFPTSNKAQSVWNVLVDYMEQQGVTVRTNAAVSGIECRKVETDSRNFEIALKDGKKILAKKCILATGGKSRPETGSTGEGFLWLKRLGHTIVENDFALVPIALKNEWVKRCAGISLPEVKLTLYADAEKRSVHKGKILFTHFGISGPTVLNMSREVGELLEYSEGVRIILDLFPTLDPGALKAKLQALLVAESNKKLKNVLGALVPTALVSPLLDVAGIDGETVTHSVRSEDRNTLSQLLKAIPLHVKELLGADKAVVSSGGVALEEVNFKTMESRIVPGLYLIGDVLNINRPSGGYSLQLCWTTGVVAGSNC